MLQSSCFNKFNNWNYSIFPVKWAVLFSEKRIKPLFFSLTDALPRSKSQPSPFLLNSNNFSACQFLFRESARLGGHFTICSVTWSVDFWHGVDGFQPSNSAERKPESREGKPTAANPRRKYMLRLDWHVLRYLIPCFVQKIKQLLPKCRSGNDRLGKRGEESCNKNTK